MDLSLARHRGFMLLHAATGRWLGVAALGRHLFGSFVRTPVAVAAPLASGAVLDFTDPVTGETGTRARVVLADPRRDLQATGRESRLVFAVTQASAMTITVHATAGRPRPLEVAVNERRVARVDIGSSADAPFVVQVPERLVRRFQPVEVVLRAPLVRCVGAGGDRR